MPISRPGSRLAALFVAVPLSIFLGASSALLGACGPFTDFTDAGFCPFVLEIFYLGITTGTTPTTYDPARFVSRPQMATFLSRTVDGVLRRGSRRAALDRFWRPQNSGALGLTTIGALPFLCSSDGADVWTANQVANSVSRVRGSDGKLLETWTGANFAYGVMVAMGRVLVTGAVGVGGPFAVYSIDPSQPAGAVTVAANAVGTGPQGITFDGGRVWTANSANSNGSVSIITPGPIPWTVTTVGTGTQLIGAVFDGTNVWVTANAAGKLFKLDPAGGILQTVTVGSNPYHPTFDGTNIWVPNAFSDSVSVVRASTGVILQTLTGNGIAGPTAAAFDGERILIAGSGGSISFWKAADLTPLGSVATGPVGPLGACSDGLQFWVTYNTSNQLARF